MDSLCHVLATTVSEIKVWELNPIEQEQNLRDLKGDLRIYLLEK